ncbi:hypothetical protein N7462_002057 [Penicillium macrosclerotiorum]|uniref:uncharacterized protein n=1 Tax=Penicillium macrosclerotiorum TaxID=303699 RepID=UPI0025494D5E|nr:uncharacterized protein N7462_002057 [Penicillium macrosclerotiorum]KAJ5692634.1 hypothetical protein N7462_002057 [Penicillium macrosclerotiorum]
MSATAETNMTGTASEATNSRRISLELFKKRRKHISWFLIFLAKYPHSKSRIVQELQLKELQNFADEIAEYKVCQNVIDGAGECFEVRCDRIKDALIELIEEIQRDNMNDKLSITSWV